MIMTPAGVVFYAGPAMDVAVAPGGEVRVDVGDCPVREAVKTSMLTQEARARCTLVTTGEEQDLVTGDRIVIGTDLAVKKSSIEDEAPDPESWVKERAESLGKDPSRAVAAYAGWVGSALGDIRSFIDEIQSRRSRNKELIKKLRDLRKAGHADASKAATNALKEGDAPLSEVAEVKKELTLNSRAQYRLRHQLLARYYQASLYFERLGAHLGDEALSSTGKTVQELGQSIGALGLEIHELIARKPRHRPMSRFTPKGLGSGPGVHLTPKKPVEKPPQNP
jgi:hypothetical protein